ncbi:MAG TPA: LeuA family protein [Vicinamibacterales bacterium]|jgi:isopropylmalate/homocitrate/citramalate synthase|nr:LeuA family protein [Vicinamibacterales bacterium]
MHPLIHDWNQTTGRSRPVVMLDDETLRDGLQSPSVRCPTIEQKIEILHLIDRLGIDTADIGLPGAGPHVVRDVERLAREIVSQKLGVKANCAARTVIADIKPVAEISQRTGLAIECCAFIGSSPVRQYAEGWSLDQLLRLTEEAVTFAVGEGLTVMYVTEDTTRADPDTLRRLYSTAIRAGASRVCVSDTVGHATPEGATAVVRFIAGVVDECGGGVGIDWHGHRDRDFAVSNSLAALEAGATRLHGAAIGIGERVGNTPMDTLLVNLVLMGYIDRDLSALVEYCEAVSKATGVPIPPNYPIVGRDAFRTATGVHAAAIVKAVRKNDHDLVDAVYSGVPAGLVGREQEVDVGPMSGRSNVIFWLEKRGLTASDEIVDRILAEAKQSDAVLSEQQIRALLRP